MVGALQDFEEKAPGQISANGIGVATPNLASHSLLFHTIIHYSVDGGVWFR